MNLFTTLSLSSLAVVGISGTGVGIAALSGAFNRKENKKEGGIDNKETAKEQCQQVPNPTPGSAQCAQKTGEDGSISIK